MKRLIALLALFAATCSPLPAQQFALDYRAGTTGIFTQKTITTGTNKLLGTLNGSDPVVITLGTGLSFTGTTLNATGGNPAWADITGKPTEFTPAAHTQAISTITGLQDALDEKLSLTGGGNLSGFISLTGDLQINRSAGGGLLETNGTLRRIRFFGENGDIYLDAQNLSSTEKVLNWPNLPFTKTIATTDQSDGSITKTDITDTAVTLADTGTVTNAMLAGSIALSKLAITGTPDGTKYLRDDGSWQTITGGATLGANTFTGIQTLPAGTVSAPALTLGDSGTGIYRSALNEFAITNNGTQRFRTTTSGAVVTGTFNVNSTNLYFGTGTNYGIGSDGSTFTALVANGANVVGGNASHGAVSVISSWGLGFSAAVNTTAPDCVLYRDAAAVLQLGKDASSPVTQTIKAHDASGTNIDGASLTLSGGNSTGTGDDGDVILRSTMTGSSGSSANTPQTRAQVVARFKNLTEATATDLVSIALASGKVTGGSATLTVWASDGTDHQTLTTQIRFGAVNKAGTVTATCNQTDGTTAASTGTLTVTCDATTTGNNVILRANATSSLTQTILRSRIVINALNGDDTQVVTPQ